MRWSSEVFLCTCKKNKMTPVLDFVLHHNRLMRQTYTETFRPAPFLDTRRGTDKHAAHTPTTTARLSLRLLLGVFGEEASCVLLSKMSETILLPPHNRLRVVLFSRGTQSFFFHFLFFDVRSVHRIQYEDDKGELAIPWQTSWGLTTRSVGFQAVLLQRSCSTL